MSYILDALRRADAERERGNVPGLHTQARPMPSMDDDDERQAAARRGVPRWVWIAGALAVAAVSMAIWRPWSASPAAPAMASAGGAVTATFPPAPPQAVAPVPVAPVPMAPVPMAPAPVTPMTAPAFAPMPSLAPVPRAAVSPAPQRPAMARPTPPRADDSPMPLRLDPRVSVPAASPGNGAPAAPPERVLRLAELPDGLRRELPQLAFGGSIHSPDPFSRMVIVNGQVRREGDAVAPGLILKRIRVNSAVFEYKGQLFETAF